METQKMSIHSTRIRSIGEEISDLETVFPVEVRLLMPLRKNAPNFNWSVLRDVGSADGSVWRPDFATSLTPEVLETSVSAFSVKDSELQWMSLAERLRFELFYYKQFGQHLDVETVTLCAGSRLGFNSQHVPTVYKNREGKGICIGFVGLKDSMGNMGPRQVWRV